MPLRVDSAEDLEEDEQEDFYREDSVADLCSAPRKNRQGNKRTRTIIGDLIDRLKREDACKIASIQDSERCHVASTRYDLEFL